MNTKKSELEWHLRLAEEIERYEEFSEYDYEKYLNHLLKETSSSQEDLILELGCGTGAFTSRLSIRGYNVLGLDISHKMLLKANSIRKNPYVQGDMEYLPFADNTFDVVFASASLHHLPSLYCCAHESYRVLKKKGVFFSLDPNRLNPLGWAEMNASFARKIIREKCMGYSPLTPNERYFTQREIKKVFRKIGFKHIRTNTVNFLPYKRSMVLRRLERIMEKMPVLNKFGGTIVHCSAKL